MPALAYRTHRPATLVGLTSRRSDDSVSLRSPQGKWQARSRVEAGWEGRYPRMPLTQSGTVRRGPRANRPTTNDPPHCVSHRIVHPLSKLLR